MSTHKSILQKTLVDNHHLVLSEADPHVEKLAGHIMVIKCSGEIVSPETSDGKTMQNFAADIVCLRALGIKPVVVHGGGRQITAALKDAGIKSSFVGGLRMTDVKTMEVVADVLINQVGKNLTEVINSAALELKEEIGTGHIVKEKDAQEQDAEGVIAAEQVQAIRASQLDEKLGFVGKVESIDTEALTQMLDKGIIPIVSSIGASPNGQLYNINADTAASEIAIAMNADRLHILTNVDGVYSSTKNFEEHFKKGSHISEITISEVHELLDAHKIGGGMIPKLEACCAALQNGVETAHILNGSNPNDLVVELFTDAGVGTMITREVKHNE